MKKATVVLKSKTPLMFEKMTDAAIDSLPGSPNKKKNDLPKDFTAEDVAEAKIYRDGKKRMGIPAEMIFAALKRAGRRVGYGQGKTKVSTAESTYLPEFFSLSSDFFPFSNLDEKGNVPWEVDKRRGVNPATGGAMCLIRPKIDEWEMEVQFEYDDTVFASDSLKQLFNYAGTGSGLGAFRPGCGGPFGCFTVAKWHEEEIKDALAIPSRNSTPAVVA